MSSDTSPITLTNVGATFSATPLQSAYQNNKIVGDGPQKQWNNAAVTAGVGATIDMVTAANTTAMNGIQHLQQQATRQDAQIKALTASVAASKRQCPEHQYRDPYGACKSAPQ